MQPLLEKHHKPPANFTTIRSMSEWKYKINSMVQNATAEKKNENYHWRDEFLLCCTTIHGAVKSQRIISIIVVFALNHKSKHKPFSVY